MLIAAEEKAEAVDVYDRMADAALAWFAAHAPAVLERKVVQLASSASGSRLALCNDGSMWIYSYSEWRQLPAIVAAKVKGVE